MNMAYISLVLCSGDYLSDLLGYDVRWRRTEEVRVGDEEGGETIEVDEIDIAGGAFLELVGAAESATFVVGEGEWGGDVVLVDEGLESRVGWREDLWLGLLGSMRMGVGVVLAGSVGVAVRHGGLCHSNLAVLPRRGEPHHEVTM